MLCVRVRRFTVHKHNNCVHCHFAASGPLVSMCIIIVVNGQLNTVIYVDMNEIAMFTQNEDLWIWSASVRGERLCICVAQRTGQFVHEDNILHGYSLLAATRSIELCSFSFCVRVTILTALAEREKIGYFFLLNFRPILQCLSCCFGIDQFFWFIEPKTSDCESKMYLISRKAKKWWHY